MRDVPSSPKPPTAQDAARQRTPPERLYMPAMPPRKLFALIGRAFGRWRVRRELRALLAQDDHILCDLGHSRSQLRRRLNTARDDSRRAQDFDACGGQ